MNGCLFWRSKWWQLFLIMSSHMKMCVFRTFSKLGLKTRCEKNDPFEAHLFALIFFYTKQRRWWYILVESFDVSCKKSFEGFLISSFSFFLLLLTNVIRMSIAFSITIAAKHVNWQHILTIMKMYKSVL